MNARTMISSLQLSRSNHRIGFRLSLSLAWLMFLACPIAHGQTIAFVDATIETADKAGAIPNGTLVVSGNKIVDVGKDIAIPDDARVISLAGKTIMPGLVDPYYVFSTSGATQAFRTVIFRGRTFQVPVRPTSTPTTFTRIGQYFYPFGFNFKPSIRSGITTAHLVGSGRGLSAFANITGDPDPNILFRKDGLLFSAVTNQTSSLDLVRKPLAEKKSSNSKTSTSKTSTTSKTTSSSTSSSLDTKAEWEKVKTGKNRLFLNMNTSAAIAHVLQIAKDNPKVKFVLVATGGNLYPLLDQLKSMKNISVILQPGIDTVPYTRNLMNVSRLLEQHKIPFALSMSLSRNQLNSNQDDPMFPLANLVHTGLGRSVALQAVTAKPAELMGIGNTHGSLATDKHANFLIFDGDPLTTGTRLEQVYVNGKKVHEN